MAYYSMIGSIPNSWKHILRQNEASTGNGNKSWKEKFAKYKHKNVAKQAYCEIRDSQVRGIRTYVTLWNNDLKVRLTEKKMKKIFCKHRKITVSEKLRFFQYRLLIRALKTNVHVSKWKNISPYCSFCKAVPEITTHLFFECQHVKKLWSLLEKWLNHFHQIRVQFNLENVILNNYNGRDSKIINMFILVTKHYIYKTKAQQGKLKFVNLMTEIQTYKNIENIIARKNDKLYQFARKWADFTCFY